MDIRQSLIMQSPELFHAGTAVSPWWCRHVVGLVSEGVKEAVSHCVWPCHCRWHNPRIVLALFIVIDLRVTLCLVSSPSLHIPGRRNFFPCLPPPISGKWSGHYNRVLFMSGGHDAFRVAAFLSVLWRGLIVRNLVIPPLSLPLP